MTVALDGLEELSAPECIDLLRTRSFGRVGVTSRALPIVAPVYYVVVDDLVVMRTQRGSPLAAATNNAIVVFEVDHIDPDSGHGWSVMVQGRAVEATADTLASVTDAPAGAAWLDPATSHHFSLPTVFVSGGRLV